MPRTSRSFLHLSFPCLLPFFFWSLSAIFFAWSLSELLLFQLSLFSYFYHDILFFKAYLLLFSLFFLFDWFFLLNMLSEAFVLTDISSFFLIDMLSGLYAPFPAFSSFLKKICYRCYFSRFVLASLPFCYIHSSLFFLPFIRRFSLKSKKEKRRSNDPFSGAFPVFLKKGGSPPPPHLFRSLAFLAERLLFRNPSFPVSLSRSWIYIAKAFSPLPYFPFFSLLRRKAITSHAVLKSWTGSRCGGHVSLAVRRKHRAGRDSEYCR